MSRTEELIAKAQQGDREASEALVEENSGLIWSVARYRTNGNLFKQYKKIR